MFTIKLEYYGHTQRNRKYSFFQNIFNSRNVKDICHNDVTRLALKGESYSLKRV